MNFKIITIIIGVAIIISALVILGPITKPATDSNDQYITKGSISHSAVNFTLPANYTSIQLLDYCSQSQSLVYDDNCLRGLWDVNDECKNGNFSSTNSVCQDPRLGQFEDKVNAYMKELDNSLTKMVNSCINVTSDNDIHSCSDNMERIKNDCSDPRLFSMWSVCTDPKIDQFNEKFKETLSKTNSQ
ncbi:hypothetical protein [Nitrosotalea sinensis]|uniref:hypothetical protein n=1 Tax=Nitrosotalea sinensis TaxID=1499975 RepID=UPI0010566357|nr:hypothetical protein [Candidatus Nitrosotalea sinensis]